MINYPYVGEVVQWSLAYVAPHQPDDWDGLRAARLEVIETGVQGINPGDMCTRVKDLETGSEVLVNPSDITEVST